MVTPQWTPFAATSDRWRVNLPSAYRGIPPGTALGTLNMTAVSDQLVMERIMLVPGGVSRCRDIEAVGGPKLVQVTA